MKLHKKTMKKASNSSLHYVVTGPSLMQDLPQVTVKVCDHDRAMSTWSQLERGSHAQRHSRDDFSIVEIVYGRAGGYMIQTVNVQQSSYFAFFQWLL